MFYVLLDKPKVKLIDPQNGSYFVLTNYIIWKNRHEVSHPFIDSFSFCYVDCDWETETVDSISVFRIDRECIVRKIVANRPLKCSLLKTFIWKKIKL